MALTRLMSAADDLFVRLLLGGRRGGLIEQCRREGPAQQNVILDNHPFRARHHAADDLDPSALLRAGDVLPESGLSGEYLSQIVHGDGPQGASCANGHADHEAADKAVREAAGLFPVVRSQARIERHAHVATTPQETSYNLIAVRRREVDETGVPVAFKLPDKV